MNEPADGTTEGTADRVAQIHESDWGRLLSLLVARTRRLDLAEDALAEAFARALDRWSHDAVPDKPAAWLYTTAHRLILGRLRAEAMAGRKAPLLAVRSDRATPEVGELRPELADDRLELILLCCHPALAASSQSALALRLVMGTSTEQIARLFLVSKSTMAARITRAKKKIVAAGIPLGAPLDAELDARLDEVCRTIYLAFTAGYAPGSGPDLLRAEEAGDAVRLGRLLLKLVPEAPQVRALVALLQLQHSRRDARVRDGQLVTLDEQDRTRWHRREIAEAGTLLAGVAASSGLAEELRLQGLIAHEHARAESADITNWPEISRRYAELETLTRSPVVRLNRAVAVAEVHGPAAGLDLLIGLDDLLSGNHRLHAVRGELAHRAGDLELARTSFGRALDECENATEQRHLTARLNELG